MNTGPATDSGEDRKTSAARGGLGTMIVRVVLGGLPAPVFSSSRNPANSCPVWAVSAKWDVLQYVEEHAAADSEEVATLSLDVNKLYYGDNLDVLRLYIKDETVDLVYRDPPFSALEPAT